LAGSDPSATDPVYVRINGTVRTCSAALAVTKNAGTNWFNSGGSELATKEIDYFAYLVWNTTPATDIVDIGFARVPYYRVYSEASATTTNEKYLASANGSAPTSTDDMVNIGRFAATLSATAAFNWSVPSFTTANLIQCKTLESRWLNWTIVYTGFSSDPTSTNIYKIIDDICFIHRDVNTNGTSNATTFTMTFPLQFAAAAANITWIGVNDNGTLASAPGHLQVAATGTIVASLYKTFYQGAWTNSGVKNAYLLDFNYKLR
jgi:hypothetical protein